MQETRSISVTSGVVVRAGDPASDRKLAVDMFMRYLNPRYDQARFDWVYQQNPHGRGRLWVASDSESGEVVGIAGAFPRRMSVFGRKETAWLLGDFCVCDSYRSVGPALALQRACLADVGVGAINFCYDFPSSRMMAIYRRLGVDTLGQMVRLSKVLRVDARLRELLRSHFLSRGLGTIASLFLVSGVARRGATRGLEVALQSAPLGREFTELTSQIVDSKVVMVERSAEYLNWRYLTNPVHRYEIVTVRWAGRLVGYSVFRQNDGTMTIVDVLADPRHATIADLVHGAIALAWRRNLDVVAISLLESSAWVDILTELGFKKREALPVVVYAARDTHPDVANGMNWFLSDGDRDS